MCFFFCWENISTIYDCNKINHYPYRKSMIHHIITIFFLTKYFETQCRNKSTYKKCNWAFIWRKKKWFSFCQRIWYKSMFNITKKKSLCSCLIFCWHDNPFLHVNPNINATSRSKSILCRIFFLPFFFSSTVCVIFYMIFFMKGFWINLAFVYFSFNLYCGINIFRSW